MMSPNRNSDFAKQPNAKMIEAMKDLIARWDLPEVNGKQRTVDEYEGYRIDQQKNGGFDKTFTDGDRKYTQRYTCLAVQKGREVFANVLLPMEVHIGKTLIRKALYQSLENGRIVSILPAPKDLEPEFKYILE